MQRLPPGFCVNGHHFVRRDLENKWAEREKKEREEERRRDEHFKEQEERLREKRAREEDRRREEHKKQQEERLREKQERSDARAKVRKEQLENICRICLRMTGRRIVSVCLECKNRFHINCLEKWMEKSNSCPLCRRKSPLWDERKPPGPNATQST